MRAEGFTAGRQLEAIANFLAKDGIMPAAREQVVNVAVHAAVMDERDRLTLAVRHTLLTAWRQAQQQLAAERGQAK